MHLWLKKNLELICVSPWSILKNSTIKKSLKIIRQEVTRELGRGLHSVRMWTCPEQLASVHCVTREAAMLSEETPSPV